MVKQKKDIVGKMPKRKQAPPPSSSDDSSSSSDESGVSDNEKESSSVVSEEIIIRKPNKVRSESSDSESDPNPDELEYKKFVSDLFTKIQKDNRKKANKKDTKKDKKKLKKRHESSDSSEESESEAYDEEDDIIALSIGNEYDNEYENYFAEEEDEKSEGECDTDDEKTFMKDKFEHVETATLIPKKKKSEQKTPEPVMAESEYTDLLEMKKSLTERLIRRPESKSLKNALKSCIKEIHTLVKDARHSNALEYKQLIKSSAESESNEFSFFKKKLSNAEQVKFLETLRKVNKINNLDKPQRLALLESDIPMNTKAIIMNKINALAIMSPDAGEYFKLKNWVDSALRIPFGKDTKLPITMADGIEACNQYMRDAKKSMDECVYGLDDAKMQIMQMAGQMLANPAAIGSTIALCGPPGTGKTSLIKNGIAKILGREFAFISLGGCGDASYLDGHSYTYEGSICGLIAKTLIEKKCSNCLFMFDELDKISDTARGQEIINLLVHLTDSTQNMDFRDKYFADISIDLSRCMFVFSYNDENLVNPILKDRFYRIYTKGYSSKEKLVIAKKHLLPKIREQVNFAETDVVFPDETLLYIINSKSLTQDEQGVRNLKRCLEVIHTKLNLFRLTKAEDRLFSKEISMENPTFPFTVTQKHVEILIKHEDRASQSMLMMYC
jgi:ATP-dependent Lon protease